jgi:hypothetical protein
MAMILALKDLDADGFFGTGPERERIILLVWVDKFEDSDAWWARSAEELNPGHVYKRLLSNTASWRQHKGNTFERWLSQARSDDAEARKEAAGALWAMGAPAVPSLVRLLEDEDENVGGG